MKTSKTIRTGLCAAFGIFAGFALQGKSLALTVTNNQDNSTGQALIAGSLRYAIANTPAGGTVNFANSLYGTTITLKGGQLVLDKTLTISGLGCGALTVSGNNASRVFYVGGSSANPGSPSAVIADITITKGNAVGPDLSGNGYDSKGGGLQNEGTLQLVRCCVTNNKSPLDSGGGIYNNGNLTITQCTISGNSAAVNGGGIADDLNLTVVNSAITNNIASGTFAGPVCGGTGRNTSRSHTCGRKGDHDDGGKGDQCDHTNGGTNNGGGYGGGIQEAGNCILINTSICSNRAYALGGGFNDAGFATLYSYNVTIAANTAVTGGGLSNPGFGSSWQLFNTLVGDNVAATAPDLNNPLGQLISKGNNLIESISGFPASSLVASDIKGVDAKLGPLQNNGGPTQTKALLPGSPAIGAGNNATVTTATFPGTSTLIYGTTPTDQRGVGRIFNGTVDIGAYEYGTAKSLKQDALAQATLASYSNDCFTWWNGRAAMRSIRCSLSSYLWTSDTRLGNCGELVFEYEEDAAFALQNIVCYSGDSAAVAAAKRALDDLRGADEQLAVIEIAFAVTGQNSQADVGLIAQANASLTAARAAAAALDYKGAIELFEQAWVYARLSLNNSSNDTDLRNCRGSIEDDDCYYWGDRNRCYFGW